MIHADVRLDQPREKQRWFAPDFIKKKISIIKKNKIYFNQNKYSNFVVKMKTFILKNFLPYNLKYAKKMGSTKGIK